jgi:hypothetical protein
MTETPTSTPERRSERSAHVIYGLIIVTTALAADRAFAKDAVAALVTVWGAGLVLLLAHLYSALVAEVGTKGRLLSHAERHLLIEDNLPLLASVVVPTVLLGASELGLLDLGLAISLSIAAAVAALFAVGAYQAARSGATLAMRVLVGSIGAGLGVAVIVLELLLAH